MFENGHSAFLRQTCAGSCPQNFTVNPCTSEGFCPLLPKKNVRAAPILGSGVQRRFLHFRIPPFIASLVGNSGSSDSREKCICHVACTGVHVNTEFCSLHDLISLGCSSPRHLQRTKLPRGCHFACNRHYCYSCSNTLNF